jgi:glycosyltransferase involved in cell wall biosynthesis
MRVGLVIYGDLEFASGGFLYDRMLVKALRRSGDTVDVLSLPWKSYAECLLQNNDRHIRSLLLGWNGDLLLEDELAHPSLFTLNRTIRRARGIPIVSIVHHLRTSEKLSWPGSAVYRHVERSYLRTVDQFVLNSEITRRTVEKLLGCPCPGIVVPPGGDRLGQGMTEGEIRRRAATPGPLRVLFVGNIIPRKGLLTLLEALGSLPRDAWRLTVVGSPGMHPGYARRVERTVAERGLEENVHMRGHLDDALLADELRTHHVLAVPSRYEGFGIVYLEAMGFGVVPIACRAGGAAEIIEDGRSGYLLPSGNAQALADAIGMLSADRERLRSIALEARRRYQAFPGWDQGMGQVREHLRSLVHAKGG